MSPLPLTVQVTVALDQDPPTTAQPRVLWCIALGLLPSRMYVDAACPPGTNDNEIAANVMATERMVRACFRDAKQQEVGRLGHYLIM